MPQIGSDPDLLTTEAINHLQQIDKSGCCDDKACDRPSRIHALGLTPLRTRTER